MQPPAPARTDGRIVRGRKTRRAILDAVLQHLDEGDLEPTAQSIADRAGVSLRALRQHFPTQMSLVLAATMLCIESVYERYPGEVSADGPLPARVDAIVARRGDILEATAALWRAAALYERRFAEIAAVLEAVRSSSRAEVERVFAGELAREPAASRRELLDALDLVLSGTTWERLRGKTKRSKAASAAIVKRVTLSVLSDR
jgi:AcrR family transcriptional regulator